LTARVMGEASNQQQAISKLSFGEVRSYTRMSDYRSSHACRQ